METRTKKFVVKRKISDESYEVEWDSRPAAIHFLSTADGIKVQDHFSKLSGCDSIVHIRDSFYASKDSSDCWKQEKSNDIEYYKKRSDF
mmetsp:Transcript_63758/g.170832  ORF Transcript_63758/g.170832 Transcript_63758/m.170832 type:complete len:89 (+) Transcript_63758:6-272(+)